VCKCCMPLKPVLLCAWICCQNIVYALLCCEMSTKKKKKKKKKKKEMKTSVIVVFCAIASLISLCSLAVNAGDTFQEFDAKWFGDALTSQFASQGSVKLRKEFRTPRFREEIRITFTVEEEALLNFRASSGEPTRLSDTVFDGSLTSSVGGTEALYLQELNNQLLEPGTHTVELRFWNTARAWRQYDNWPYNDDEDNDEPSFWLRMSLSKPTERQRARAIRAAQEASESGQSQQVEL
jgi:hypothetical protein